MKATDKFVEIINSHLQGLAEKDPLFAETLKKPAKNIKDCIDYIFNTVQKTGRQGFADEEVFDMAVHYYDEDDIKPVASRNCKVVVNHAIKNEKPLQKPAAIPEEKKTVKRADKKGNKKQVSDLQPSLFS